MKQLRYRAVSQTHKSLRWQFGNIVVLGFGEDRKDDLEYHMIHQRNNDGNMNFNRVYHDSVGSFTGLHDINGTEIYEGDFLDHSEGRCYVRYNELTFSYEVVFDDEGVISLWEATNYGSEKLEIIGNQFEEYVEKRGIGYGGLSNEYYEKYKRKNGSYRTYTVEQKG